MIFDHLCISFIVETYCMEGIDLVTVIFEIWYAHSYLP